MPMWFQLALVVIAVVAVGALVLIAIDVNAIRAKIAPYDPMEESPVLNYQSRETKESA
jgi:hypothetical protein